MLFFLFFPQRGTPAFRADHLYRALPRMAYEIETFESGTVEEPCLLVQKDISHSH
jgi:hypothetical protein